MSNEYRFKIPADTTCSGCGSRLERGTEVRRISGKGVFCDNCKSPSDQDTRDLDLLIGRDVIGLPGVGYYRRKSCYEAGHEPCNKGDVTPDYPAWEASLYYKHPATGVFSVPRYTKDISDAWQVMEALAVAHKPKMTFEDDGRWKVVLVPRTGSPVRYVGISESAAMAICLAALKTVGVIAG